MEIKNYFRISILNKWEQEMLNLRNTIGLKFPILDHPQKTEHPQIQKSTEI